MRPPAPRGAAGRAALGLALLGLVFLSHWNNVVSPLLPCGDLPHALGNPGVRDLGNLRRLLSPEYVGLFWEGSFHPLATALYSFNYALFGLDPTWFFVLELLLVWGIALLIGLAGREDSGGWAWAAAALFAVHPMHGDRLMLVVRDQLAAFFCLLGLVAHRRSAAAGYPARGALALSAIFLLALFSKETGAVFPALLAATDLLSARAPPDRAARRRWAAAYAALGVVLLAYLGLRSGIVSAGGEFHWGFDKGWAAAQPLSRARGYAAQLMGLAPGAGRWWFLLPAALGASFLVAPGANASPDGARDGSLPLAAGKKDARIAAAHGAWIALALLPVSGLVPIRPLSEYLSGSRSLPPHHLVLAGAGYVWLLAHSLKAAADRRRWPLLLLPLGLALPLVAGARPLPARPDRVGPFPCASPGGRVDAGGDCVASLTCALLSLPRMRERGAREYGETRAAVEAVLGEKTPAFEAYFDGALADPCRTVYMLRRTKSADLAGLWRGMRADRAFVLGSAALRAGKADAAVLRFQEAVSLDAAHADAYAGLARARWRGGDLSRALSDLERHRLLAARDLRLQGPWCFSGRLDATPLEETWRSILKAKDEGIGLFLAGRRKEARDRLIEAARLKPLDPEIYLSLGVVQDALGDLRGALTSYEGALRSEKEIRLFLAKAGEDHPGGSLPDAGRLRSVILSSRAETWIKLGRRDLAAADLARKAGAGAAP